METIVAAILGGGQGARLWPLTQHRAKPSVPVAGKFRLIDVPISNCLHAGIHRIFVLTQFNSASLHRHIAQTYRFDAFRGGFVNILAAAQSLEHRDWFQGTADAVRQTLNRLIDAEPSEILILSGDQLYLMDLRAFIERHRASAADLTIGVQLVASDAAPALGMMRLESDGRIVEFVEKPTDPRVINGLALEPSTIASLGIEAEAAQLPASMGIYAFRPEVLRRLLEQSSAADFGKEVIPQALGSLRVFGFLHRGYWRDIGTIPSYHEASLELAGPVPALNLYDEQFPIYTHPRFLPGAKISDCSIRESIVCDGSRVSGARIERSVIGIRAQIREGSTIEETVVMGANRFEDSATSNDPALGIGRECQIRRAIVDLDARIGDECRLINETGIRNVDGDGYHIREGVIVVARGAVIPAGTVI